MDEGLKKQALEKLSARFNFDVNAIFKDLRKRQDKLGKRLVRPKKDEEAAVPGRNPAALHPGR